MKSVTIFLVFVALICAEVAAESAPSTETGKQDPLPNPGNAHVPLSRQAASIEEPKKNSTVSVPVAAQSDQSVPSSLNQQTPQNSSSHANNTSPVVPSVPSDPPPTTLPTPLPPTNPTIAPNSTTSTTTTTT